MVEDFLYICDGAYTQRELIRMEMNVLRVVNFDLGIPLSYRFLRRYARVSNAYLLLSIYVEIVSRENYSTSKSIKILFHILKINVRYISNIFLFVNEIIIF